MSIQSSSLDWIARTGGESDQKENILRKVKTQAFEEQMRLVQSFAGTEEDPENGGVSDMESSIFNDALMYDALSTIARLTGGAGLGRSLSSRLGMNAYSPSSLGAASSGGAERSVGNMVEEMLGRLSARFESGEKGIEAVGHDRVGGTSYGKYQIASRTGSMDDFLDYLDDRAPDIARQLRQAGPADTGSTAGAMPDAWRKVASTQPERFEKLQHDFIKSGHYSPARDRILEATGIDLDKTSSALQEVLWSTSVQHGATGAANIFNRVIDGLLGREGGLMSGEGGLNLNQSQEKGIIEDVYSIRSTQFGSSTERVRQSVQSRLLAEKDMALSMLDGGTVSV